MPKIYTKKGDRGCTCLLSGERANKDCCLLRVTGEIDELNSIIGVARSEAETKELNNFLGLIQRDLFKAGAEISTAQNKNIIAKLRLLNKGNTKKLEKQIDKYWKQLPPLKNFILPGGCDGAALLHLARAVCRRVERALVALGREIKVRPELYKYFNRLSDFLFTAARWENKMEKQKEERV